MTPLNSDATWSSVHGSVTGFGGWGPAGAVGVWAGVSTSMASSSRADEGVAPAWVLARPPFFLGGMLMISVGKSSIDEIGVRRGGCGVGCSSRLESATCQLQLRASELQQLKCAPWWFLGRQAMRWVRVMYKHECRKQTRGPGASHQPSQASIAFATNSTKKRRKKPDINGLDFFSVFITS